MLHATSDGVRLLGEGRGPALGLLDEVDYAETRLRLAGPDRLLLYSDGLVERRDVPLPDRLDALCAAAAAGGEPDALLDDVLAALDPPDTDDVTLVGLGRT